MNTLVTCHANADFDALAAVLAARHLYAPCGLLFPGTQERPLQKVYADLDKTMYGFVEAGKLRWDDFDRLILVDTRQRDRVRHVAPLLERKRLVVEAWDHHPDSPDDITADAVHTAPVGAVTTLLALHLQQNGARLTRGEATLLGLGIYSDTGSFTYPSTTAEDLLATAWLLAQGMDVNQINEMASHELTSLHIQALNSLLESARTYTINNCQVVLAEASLEHYLGDFASLAHKLMEMEELPVLFAVGRMGDHIQVVARSRNKAVDVGEICKALGGGGHAYAASASVRSMLLHEVRDAILRRLKEKSSPGKTAREYMVSPAVGIDATATIREADALMLHFGLKAVPVFQAGTRVCVGLLDAQTASRAGAHGLGNEQVDEYMQRRVHTLPPQASLQDLTDVIVGARQRLTPIVEDDQVIGVVTRTDLINFFAGDPGQLSVQKHRRKERNIGRYIRDRLPAESRNLLNLAGELGAKLGLQVYAVGGFVRDLLLNKPTRDIDLVVEGNGTALARALASELNGRVREHQKFLTSVVIFHDREGRESRIDVVTARLEYYEYPAALPTVELSSIKMDLFRRDFSVNALAVRLDGEHYGQLADFFGGYQDIKNHTIRVLHTLSFVEDPTRCLRALRFEQRYKFNLGAGTEKLIKNALSLKLMDRLSPARLFNEYRHICDEADPPPCFIRMNAIGILQAINPTLALNPGKVALLRRQREMFAWYTLLYSNDTAQPWLVYFYGLNTGLPYKETSENYDRMGLPQITKKEILQQREQMRMLRDKLKEWQRKDDTGSAKTSSLHEMLRPVSPECLLTLMATADNPGLQKNLSRYITQWRREKPDITGDDLHRLGLAPGPLYSYILQAVLAAKLDGAAGSVEGQFRLAKKLIREAEEGSNEQRHQNEQG